MKGTIEERRLLRVKIVSCYGNLTIASTVKVLDVDYHQVYRLWYNRGYWIDKKRTYAINKKR